MNKQQSAQIDIRPWGRLVSIPSGEWRRIRSSRRGQWYGHDLSSTAENHDGSDTQALMIRSENDKAQSVDWAFVLACAGLTCSIKLVTCTPLWPTAISWAPTCAYNKKPPVKEAFINPSCTRSALITSYCDDVRSRRRPGRVRTVPARLALALHFG